MVPSEHRTKRNKVSTHCMCPRMQRQHPPAPWSGVFPLPVLLLARSGLSRDSTCTSSPQTPICPCPPQGYSFVAPSILFDHNNAVMTDVLEAPGAGDRPGRAAVARSAMMQVGWARMGRS